MLNKHKISIISESTVNDVKIASFSASLDVNTAELRLGTSYIDSELCKVNRDVVRADQKTFEDFAYSLQDYIKGVTE